MLDARKKGQCHDQPTWLARQPSHALSKAHFGHDSFAWFLQARLWQTLHLVRSSAQHFPHVTHSVSPMEYCVACDIRPGGLLPNRVTSGVATGRQTVNCVFRP